MYDSCADILENHWNEGPTGFVLGGGGLASLDLGEERGTFQVGRPLFTHRERERDMDNGFPWESKKEQKKCGLQDLEP